MIFSSTKRKVFMILVVLVIVFTSGCRASVEVKRDVVPKIVQGVVQDTKDAIATKNVETARNVWSRVSEYSLKAQESGDKELSSALSTVAATYVNLIEFCQTGEEVSLQKFENDFIKSFEEMKKIKEIGEIIKEMKIEELLVE